MKQLIHRTAEGRRKRSVKVFTTVLGTRTLLPVLFSFGGSYNIYKEVFI